MKRTLLLAIGSLSLAALPALAKDDFSKVPGTVISHQRAPNPLRAAFGEPKYIGSPSLAVLPNGHYVASHDLFTRGGGPTSERGGVTKVFRSTDRGQSWQQVSTVQPAFWATLFVHGGELYLFGYRGYPGDALIRRSDDEGRTWTEPKDAASGLIKRGRYGGTPNRPARHGGRLWLASGTAAFSAPLGADLLQASAWSRTRGVPGDKSSWLGGRFKLWSEGQIVASPQTGVVLLPKVGGLPWTGRIQLQGPSARPRFDPERDFAHLPGAEKKFGAAYDPVSRKFYALTNPVLDRHSRKTWDGELPAPPKPALVRNAAAIYTSTDLRTWELDRIFLYHPNARGVAFQYLNFEFEGEDLLIVSRTAYCVNLFWPPPRGHDSNLMTFHRIKDFRRAPAHKLPEELRKAPWRFGLSHRVGR